MRNKHLFLYYLTCFFSIYSWSVNATGTESASKITVEQAYIRASIPGSNITSSYMTIVNNSEKTVTLLGAQSTISPRIEIHYHNMENGMMRMRKLDSIIIKANQRVILQPSGLHLMLFDVKKPLKPKQKVNLTLRFAENELLPIEVPVISSLNQKSANTKPMQHHH